MSRPPALPAAARRIVARDRPTLARVISQVEDGDPAVVPVLRALYGRTGGARVVGITGPLGVGKSTLVNALLGFLRETDRRVGVVAVDPSSPYSGGAVLGDRIRIDRRADYDRVFFRSMGSRGHAGGVARATREVVRLLDAFGMNVVLIETVGSGQVDVEIRTVASTNLVVVVPHLGDEVQSLKAGLFEIADVFCVNKSDLPGADAATRYLRDMVALGARPDGWRPPVVAVSASGSTGLDELWAAVDAHERFLDEEGRRLTRDRERLTAEVLGLVRDRFEKEIARTVRSDPVVRRLVDRLVARTLDPESAADALYRIRSRGR